MKIRIQGNSIRLRLGQTEVKTLGEHGFLLETTQFPNGDFFDYSVVSECVDEPTAFVLENGIQIALPENDCHSFASSDEVSLEAALDLPEGGQLAILVEKDFTCLKSRSGEDESDLYPNPALD